MANALVMVTANANINTNTGRFKTTTQEMYWCSYLLKYIWCT